MLLNRLNQQSNYKAVFLCLFCIGILFWVDGGSSLLKAAQPQTPASASSSVLSIDPSKEPVVAVVQKVKPTVVNIFTERMIEQPMEDPVDEFYETFFGGRFSRTVRTPIHNLGSGVLVSPEGYIVTNQHVVERAADLKIKATLDDGTDCDATLVAEDLDTDLALIKISSSKPFKYFDIRNLSPNLLGQTVIAIGNPIGYESSVSKGILSAKNRTIKMENFRMEGLLQTDAAINPGNSGGPLVDINGNLVGLNTVKMMAAKQVTIENIGFAVPGEKVKHFVENAIAVAKGQKPAPPSISLAEILKERLGLHVRELRESEAALLGMQESGGLMIESVDPSSPAGEAEIQPGMLILAIEGDRIHSIDDTPRSLARLKSGDDVHLTLMIFARQGPMLFQRIAPILLTAS